jgi:hypothetical protein
VNKLCFEASWPEQLPLTKESINSNMRQAVFITEWK